MSDKDMVDRSDHEDAKCVDPGAFLLAFLLISPRTKAHGEFGE